MMVPNSRWNDNKYLAMGEDSQSGKNWSRVAALYAKSVDENNLRSASGAACSEMFQAVDQVLPFGLCRRHGMR